MTAAQQGAYTVECYANKTSSTELGPSLLAEASKILDYYTQQWTPLPLHTLAVTPIAGYFGQGFPGLIYLSSMSYIRPEDRPAQLRSPRTDAFFSELLLPHELAHQWWGNIVRSADYRAAWLTEAMANDSALEFLGNEKGQEILDQLLLNFRNDLTAVEKGKSMESAGPVDFGERILASDGLSRWHTITYEKGAWILHMLRERVGDQAFRQMQLRLLNDYKSKPITNDEFRNVASQFVPADQPDRSLTMFFDTWVYSTGIPKLRLAGSAAHLEVDVSGVDDDFTADVPIACSAGTGKPTVHWFRVSSGPNPIDIPEGLAHCQLPAPTDFLYVQ